MAVDTLQEKIRKLKNPSMLLLACGVGELPPDLEPELSQPRRYEACYTALLENLKDLVPAVRVSFSAFALMGPEGLGVLSGLLEKARALGYYVALDAPQMLSAQAADQSACVLMG